MTRADLAEKIERWRVVIDRATDADTLRNELVHAVDLAEKLAGSSMSEPCRHGVACGTCESERRAIESLPA